jgi:hypothetical protein
MDLTLLIGSRRGCSRCPRSSAPPRAPISRIGALAVEGPWELARRTVPHLSAGAGGGILVGSFVVVVAGACPLLLALRKALPDRDR